MVYNCALKKISSAIVWLIPGVLVAVLVIGGILIFAVWRYRRATGMYKLKDFSKMEEQT